MQGPAEDAARKYFKSRFAILQHALCNDSLSVGAPLNQHSRMKLAGESHVRFAFDQRQWIVRTNMSIANTDSHPNASDH